MIKIAKGQRVEGTNPVTGRSKMARGTGRVVRRYENRGFYGPTLVVLWSNGVESYHDARDLDNSIVVNLPAFN